MYPRRPCLFFILYLYLGCSWRICLKAGKDYSERSFGLCLPSPRMVISCGFERLKWCFGCWRKEMNINLYRVPAVIHSCFILHNFSEIRSENVNKKDEESIITINNFNLIWKQAVKWMTMTLVVKWSGMFMLNKYFE